MYYAVIYTRNYFSTGNLISINFANNGDAHFFRGGKSKVPMIKCCITELPRIEEMNS